MLAARHHLPQTGPATALIVVFPALAVTPEAMIATMQGFLGGKLIVVTEAEAPVIGLPPAVQSCVDLQALSRHAAVTKIAASMFGNRRGLMLPVDLAVEIVATAGLVAEQDRLLITGCYRGWGPGSIDVLAEALSAIYYLSLIHI